MYTHLLAACLSVLHRRFYMLLFYHVMFIYIGYRLSPTTYSKETRFIIESLIRVLSTIKSTKSNDAMRRGARRRDAILCDAISMRWDAMRLRLRCDTIGIRFVLEHL